MTEHPEWPLEKRRAFATFKQHIAEITGTELDANGDLDEDALTFEDVFRALVFRVAEAGGFAAEEDDDIPVDDALTKDIAEVMSGMLSEDDRKLIRWLMHMDGEDE